jgi:hypothetical protein
MLLHEFKLSPAMLLDKFNNTIKSEVDTYTLYASRLKAMLLYYVEARKADSYDVLIDLLICDRIKSRQ